MKYDLCLSEAEIRVTLSESLKLPEGRKLLLESPAARDAFDLLPQIESLLRQFLDGFAEGRGGSR